MKFEKASDFFQAAKDGKIAVDGAKAPRMWLPQSLLEQPLKYADKLGTWTIEPAKPNPKLVLKQEDGTEMTGTFTLPANQHPVVKVDVKPKAPATQPAKPTGDKAKD
jgi:hypothetical protein